MSKRLTFENWDQSIAEKIIESNPDYLDILKWAFNEYEDEIVYACSFGAEGIVLIDLINNVSKEAKIIFLDTGLHFPETYELIEKVKKRYPSLNITMIKPKLSLQNQAEHYGKNLWSVNPNQCCYLRKIAPLKDALKEVNAWISGLRREQSSTRKNTQFINKDGKFQKIKICPLIHWTWDDIMGYIKLNNLPYNSLHDKGYPSIGCAPCTHPVSESEDPRAGRWAGHTKTECGLHYD